MTLELSRVFLAERAADGMTITVTPTPAERAAIARRMGLAELQEFTCRFTTSRGQGRAIDATGTLSARVVQTCVVSLENFEELVGEDFEVRFVPAGTESEDLDLEATDEVPYDGVNIDFGEAACEQLALALDPFPRKPGVDLPDGVEIETEDAPGETVNPFGALKALRGKE